MSFCVTHCTHYTWSCKDRDTYWNTVITSIIIIGIQPLGRFGQRTGLSHATSMTLVRCILGKFLGVVWHCFPPRLEVPTFATTRDILAAELWARMLSGNFAEMTPFRDLLHSANLRNCFEQSRKVSVRNKLSFEFARRGPLCVVTSVRRGGCQLM